MKFNKITLITSNPGKAEQVAKYLGIPIEHKYVELDEIQEFDIDMVITHKLKQAYKAVKSPVIVDDVSVIVNSLGKLPGPFIKWFANGLGYDKFCRMLDYSKDRSAKAIVAIGFHDGKVIKIFKGEITGTIAKKASQGVRGFGWDVVFIPKGHKKIRTELNEKDYDKTSPRRMALEKFKDFLADPL